jgi:hypothetical protein
VNNMGRITTLSRVKNLRILSNKINSSSGRSVSFHIARELTTVSHNYYGTTTAAVEAVGKTGRTCILDIEMEVGALENVLT